ncbi:MAG: tail fiber domain-containing protein [bacterium]|nr:tail fiber domain-containing protein [bacterium]
MLVARAFRRRCDAYKTSGGSAWTICSDERLEHNIEPVEGALERMLALRGVTFEWRNPGLHGDRAHPEMGLIAQEVEQHFPEWIEQIEVAGGDRELVKGGRAKAVGIHRRVRVADGRGDARAARGEGRAARGAAFRERGATGTAQGTRGRARERGLEVGAHRGPLVV